MKIEPHFYASLLAAYAACDLLDFIPKGDMYESLFYIISTQRDLMIHLLQGRHYGSDDIDDFISYIREVNQEVNRLRDAR
jgi:hypothetical protein